MDFVLLILYLAFITIICYIVTYIVLYMSKLKYNKVRRSGYDLTKEKAKEISDRTELAYRTCYAPQPTYTSICNEAFYKALMYKDGSGVQDKYKETLPKHSTRIKLREARKLRNKRCHGIKGIIYFLNPFFTAFILLC